MAWGMEIVTNALKHASYCVLHSNTDMLALGVQLLLLLHCYGRSQTWVSVADMHTPDCPCCVPPLAPH
jgi:hypothetical protein